MSGKGRAPTAAAETVGLPAGVTPAAWASERNRLQNPRIRCVLGSTRLLDEVLESNFAILHASPRRLLEIHQAVRQVRDSLRAELLPLLRQPSCIPGLGAAVAAAEADLVRLDQGHLARLDAFPVKPASDDHDRLRELLAELVGRLHGFLTGCLGRLLEADPRSQQDTDYFLSRRFARDVDDAEWLLASVTRLEQYVARLNRFRLASLPSVAHHAEVEGDLPAADTWVTTELYLAELSRGLVPRLQKMIGLRGIRLDEVQAIERFMAAIPARSALISEVYGLGREALDAATAVDAAAAVGVRRVVTARFVARMRALDETLVEVATFVPAWRAKLTDRRALSFKKKGG